MGPFIFQPYSAIFKEKIQPAWPIYVEAFRYYGHMASAPFAILVQLTRMATGKIKLEVHSNPAVGFFCDLDRIVTRPTSP